MGSSVVGRRKFTTPSAREAHLAHVASLYVAHTPLGEIAARCSVSRSQVGYDLQILKRRWREASLRDIAARLAEELAKLDSIERECWEGWSRSLHEKTKTRRKLLPVNCNQDGIGASFADDEIWVQSETSSGDPKWLDSILRCMERRARLLSLDYNGRQPAESAGNTVKKSVLVERLRAYAVALGLDPDEASRILTGNMPDATASVSA